MIDVAPLVLALMPKIRPAIVCGGTGVCQRVARPFYLLSGDAQKLSADSMQQ